MSFLFRKEKGKTPPGSTSLPSASREIRSSDGPNGTSGIPTFSKPGSPAPGQQSVNNSLNSLTSTERPPSTKTPEEKVPVYTRGEEGGRAFAGPPSPEQKTLRDRSQDTVRRL